MIACLLWCCKWDWLSLGLFGQANRTELRAGRITLDLSFRSPTPELAVWYFGSIGTAGSRFAFAADTCGSGCLCVEWHSGSLNWSMTILSFLVVCPRMTSAGLCIGFV